MTSVKSTFKNDAEDWTVSGVSSFGFKSKGGNPDGYLTETDSAGSDNSLYVAPGKFLGNDQAYYGGTLSYDVKAAGTGAYKANYADLYLSDGEHYLVAVGNKAVGTDWTHETIKLKEGSLYDVDLETGQVTGLAAKDEIKQILSNLQFLAIRSDYHDGAEKGGLDNVILKSAGKSAADIPEAAPGHFEAPMLGHAAHMPMYASVAAMLPLDHHLQIA